MEQIITVADLIEALQKFDPATPVGTDDYLFGEDALYLGALRLDSHGILRVGTGGRYSGRIPTGCDCCDVDEDDDEDV